MKHMVNTSTTNPTMMIKIDHHGIGLDFGGVVGEGVGEEVVGEGLEGALIEVQ